MVLDFDIYKYDLNSLTYQNFKFPGNITDMYSYFSTCYISDEKNVVICGGIDIRN